MYKGEATGLKDPLNIKLHSCNLNIVDQAWEETLVGMQQEPENDFLGSLYHRHLKNTTLLKNALALQHSDQVHRKGQRSSTKLKAVVKDILEDKQQEQVMA